MYFMMGATEGSTKVVFTEKPGNKPATPGLQGIGLSPTPRRPRDAKTLFVAFLGINQLRQVGLRFVLVL